MYAVRSGRGAFAAKPLTRLLRDARTTTCCGCGVALVGIGIVSEIPLAVRRRQTALSRRSPGKGVVACEPTLLTCCVELHRPLKSHQIIVGTITASVIRSAAAVTARPALVR